MTKSEMLFYYESRNNPNGDPDADNQPRLMPDNTIMVTDVRIKRTMRDYAKQQYGYTLFVDFGDNGVPVTADKRAIAIKDEFDKNNNDYIEVLLKNTFDVPLFGALVTIRDKKSKDDGSQKITGPVQFGIARSVNKPNILQPTITSLFVGDEKKGAHTTIGAYYAVDYALIKCFGVINPVNLNKYIDDPVISKNFTKYVTEIPDILWQGTNNLTSRSKVPQKSIMYIQVDYKDNLYNDLPDLVIENETVKGKNISALGSSPFDFTLFSKTLLARKGQIEQIKIKCIESIQDDVQKIIDDFDGKIKVKLIQ